MPASGRSFDPTKPPRLSVPTVDYSLARRSVLSRVRRGLMGVTDVCDAHPELLRAAKNIGLDADYVCPICSHESVRLVRYVYGEGLKRDNGRVVYPADWLGELAQSHDQFTCYVVEVCVDCAWNHLVRSYQVGRHFTSGNGTRERREPG